jgi:cytochrome c5
MSDVAHEESHEGPIKTPKQLVVAVVASFVIPIVAIILIAHFVAFGTKPGAGSTELGAESVARRLAPIGTVEVRDASAPQVLRTGEQVFTGVCGACHGTGAAGAPKPGDTAAWAPRLKQGYEALVTAALKGKGAMPPQSGGDYSDVEIARAVVHMTNQSGAKFEEPKAPAAAASAPASAASN